MESDVTRSRSMDGRDGGGSPEEGVAGAAPPGLLISQRSSWVDRHRWWLVAMAALLVNRVICSSLVIAAARLRGMGALGSPLSVLAYGYQPVSGASGAVGQWDSLWYLAAAEHGWPHHPVVAHFNTTGFFPALPLAIRAVHAVVGLNWTESGLVVSAVTQVAAVLLVAALTRRVLGNRTAERAAILFCLFPGAYVFALIYSEALFVALAAGCLLALHRRWWLVAGLAAALAGATRLTGAVLVVCCAWVALRELRTNRAWRSLLAPLLAPVGLIGFLGFLWVRTGSPLVYFHTQDAAFGERLSATAFFHTVVNVIHPSSGQAPWVGVVVLAVFGAPALVLLAHQTWRGVVPSEWFVYALGTVFVALPTTDVGLRPRFALVAFPLLVGLAARFKEKEAGLLLVVAVFGAGLATLALTLSHYIP